MTANPNVSFSPQVKKLLNHLLDREGVLGHHMVYSHNMVGRNYSCVEYLECDVGFTESCGFCFSALCAKWFKEST